MPEQKLGLKLSDLEDDVVVAAEAGSGRLVIVKHGGRVYALDAKCTHESGELGQGYIDNDELICSVHSGAFALESAKASENTPWVTDLRPYRTRVDGPTGEIYVEV